MKQSKLNRVRQISLATAACAAIASAMPARATDFVITTSALTDAQYSAFLAAAGLTNSSPTLITPTSAGATINGTPIRFNNTTNGDSTFNIAGNLTLGASDRILLIGDNLATLNVGGDATLAPGAVITAQAWGTMGGAGGGNGGAGGVLRPTAIDPATRSLTGGRATTGENPQAQGATGAPGPAVSIQNPELGANLLPNGGTNGGEGVHNTGTAGIAPPSPPDSAQNSVVLAAGGAGGAGGGPGENGDDIAGGLGSEGGTGGIGNTGGNGVTVNGINGTKGGDAGSLVHFHAFSGGSGGGGGQAGGQGQAGGTGGQGGQGGGGGNGADIVASASAGGRGGDGGLGGLGTNGGQGGAGGNGGAGGGGVELLVQGRLVQYGATNASATAGAAGVAGSAGDPGTVNTQGATGKGGNLGVRNGLLSTGGTGGQGGTGGNGGLGGTGGNGGAGGSGAGGSVMISAANVTYGSTASQDISDGNGSTSNGTFLSHGFNANTGRTANNDSVAHYAAGANPFRSYYVDPNAPISLLYGPLDPSMTPNLTQLVGGAAPYGIIANSNGAASTNVGASLNLPARPSNTAVVISRQAANGTVLLPDSYAGYDTLDYVNVSGYSVKNPGLVLNSTADNNPASSAPVAFVESGYVTDPAFTPGATGPITVTALGDEQTYGTLIESGGGTKAYTVTATFTPYTNPRTYTGTLSPSGTFYLPDTGLVSLTRASVAAGPIATIDFTNNPITNTSYVRAGVQQKDNISLANGGSPISLLTGTISLVGGQVASFSQLSNASPRVVVPLWTHTFTRGDTQTATGTIATDAGGGTYSVSSTGVGPVFDTANTTAGPSGPTFNVGSVNPGKLTVGMFLVGNADQTAQYLPAPYNALGNLDILSATLTGSPAFSIIVNPAQPGVPLNPESDGTGLYGDQSYQGMTIAFNPLTPGNYTADIAFQTDVDAMPGQPGEVYHLTLTGTAVPEPACLAIGMVGGAALLVRRRTRRGCQAAAAGTSR